MNQLASSSQQLFRQLQQKCGLWLILPLALITTIASSSLSKPVQAQSNGQALTVLSDIQEANSETGVVTARGNVRLYYPARNIQATSAQAQYFSRERRLVLTGNVYVLQNGNTIRAETITYLIDEGRFVATPQASRQVESVYLVDDEEAEGNSNPPPTPPQVPPNNPQIPTESQPSLSNPE